MPVNQAQDLVDRIEGREPRRLRDRLRKRWWRWVGRHIEGGGVYRDSDAIGAVLLWFYTRSSPHGFIEATLGAAATAVGAFYTAPPVSHGLFAVAVVLLALGVRHLQRAPDPPPGAINLPPWKRW